MKEKILKEGDLIEWSFPVDHNWVIGAGKTFSAEIVFVSKKNQEYHVYADYGPDMISFDNCRLIKEK